ncbi:M-protein, striated muscle isoform X1 [Tachysurus vachellii]|uniref:M-protein, striated muscle isoform X1 n=2 Tax=Tachysurus vachellii TaxID=175792 RepID=UPI00296B4999|nr:M-protein, striated muscle isoform X1 [Tachysurus vachellii]
MSGSIPFYQKQHRHYDRAYRSREAESTISQYQQSSSTYSAHRTNTKGIRDTTFASLDETGVSPKTKRAKPSYLAVDRENQIIGYVVPIFRGSQEFASGLSDTEEAQAKQTAGYLARRDLFSSGVELERMEHKSRRTVMRESAERISLTKRIHDNEEYHKRLNEDNLMHTPEFVIKPRSHTVWEKQCVRLHCTVTGWPEPRIVWYKNNVSIDPMAHPGKYKLVSSYNVHSLEINRCDFDDTAQYRVSAMNSKGELSAFASVVVKRFKGEVDESLPTPKIYKRWSGSEVPCLEYGVTFETHIVEKFGVSFGREGETMSLGCSVIIYPSLQRFQPEIEWYRDDKLLVTSKWVQMHWSGERATLTLTHLNKEDEGLYTLRVITKSGYETHSAYVFVRDSDAEVAGAPGAPLDVFCQEANKDYVIVTWKQPAVDGSSAVLGYFVDRCEVGTSHWIQCNDTPVKFARFPVTGLVEGRSYIFRVRAVNKCGMSHPSRVSEPVAAMDPADRARKGASAPWTGQIIVTEEEPVEGVVPCKPRDLTVIEATKNYVVLSWKPPGDKGYEGVMYYVEKCVSGTDSWQRVNTELPVKSPRFALFDLSEGKSYCFRVRCSNSAGVGEPSDPTEPTQVGDKLDIPSAPGRVVPTRNTDTSVVVSWEASREAKELVGYYIETSIAGSNAWEPCNNKPVKATRFVCHGLTTGEKYVFRVRAVNAAGISEFSQESEAIEVKAAIGGGIPHGVFLESGGNTVGLTQHRPGKEGRHVTPGSPATTQLTSLASFSKRTNSAGHLGPPSALSKGKGGKRCNVTWAPDPSCEFYTQSGTNADPKMASETGTSSNIKVPKESCSNLKNNTGCKHDTNSVTKLEPKPGSNLDITMGTALGNNTDTNSNANTNTSRPTAEQVPNHSADRVMQHITGPASEVQEKCKSSIDSSSEQERKKENGNGRRGSASPAPPFGISVLESVRDSMVLAWKQPTFIGGADIVGYFVDYREVIGGVPGKWHEANIKAVSERAYRVSDLKENMLYQFQVRAANMAGVGLPSLPSQTFKCEEWTIAVPGPPHDLQVLEVRKDSLVLLWKPPVYVGRDEVNGYYIDIKEADADFEKWRGVNEKATSKTYMKIKDLKEGVSYVFRVRAQNKAGVGKASEETEPVLAETKPGTMELLVDVDDEGVISMNFECQNLTAESKFIWSKNYEEMKDTNRLTMETKGNKSKAIFNCPSEEDLGIYSCAVTHTDGASASYTLTEEGLKELLKISHDHKFPIIPLKSELGVQLLEKGRVRFWLQAEKISANGKVEYVFNDNLISQGEKYKMNFDKNTGIIEMFMESLVKEDEGTYTFQLQDGKATNQSSLVLIGDVFKQLQKESEFQRKEWHRKQGPHFVEYLSYEVTAECLVRLKCKVGNMKKDSVALWYKDGREIKASEKLDFAEGVLTLEITKISKKDAGVYEVIVKDDRGQDKSTLNLTDQGFKDLMNHVFSVIANSSTPLKIQSNEEGIRLYTFVNYYNDELLVTWQHKDSAIAFSDRIKSGVVGEQLWLQISEPTEKDKGKYAIEFSDGKGGLKRTIELAGQAYDDAYAEFQRLKAAAIAERNRARVAGGLPDVVTIQEGKALNLTCNISGDPVPEVTWLKNEREMVSDSHYVLKFESGKFASFTITSVNTSDSGKYSILVKNKYGTESSEFTLEVTENMGDLGVVSYLNDEHGNVVIGPTACLSKLPKPNISKPAISSTPTPKPSSITPLSPTSTTPSEEMPKKKMTDERKREKKKVMKRKDSVILKIPAGEAESQELSPTTTPAGTGTMPLPDPGPEA